jgi:hypothetical protein
MGKVMILLGIVFMQVRHTENAIKLVYFDFRFRGICSTMGDQVAALARFMLNMAIIPF